jgi:hypothetical protein
VRLTIVLLLAAVGLLSAALGTDHTGLAWGSAALSVVAAAIILRRWRRSWLERRDAPEDEPFAPASGSAEQKTSESQAGAIQSSETQADEGLPGEEDTDAADLLVVYGLTDEVLVIDEHPRYHLAHCRWPDHERAERLPVREARELGFTPCDRCRPDQALARKHRAAGATAAGS